MMDKFGPPHQASTGRLIWHNTRRAMKAMRAGKTPEIMQRLMFDVIREDTGELDRAII